MICSICTAELVGNLNEMHLHVQEIRKNTRDFDICAKCGTEVRNLMIRLGERYRDSLSEPPS